MLKTFFQITKDIQPQCEVFLKPYFVQVLVMGVNCKRPIQPGIIMTLVTHN